MSYTVPAFSIVCMGINVFLGLAIPAALFLVCRKKFHADVLPFFVGCAVFIVFTHVLEGTVHHFVLASDLGRVISGNVWLYGAYGGLMAGIFEETGRYTAYKTVLKKKLADDRNALMYGAGHGGIEAFTILVFSFVPYMTYAFTLNAGAGDRLTAGITDPVTLQGLNAMFASLAGTPSLLYLISPVERIAAVVIQVSLSVLVWFAAKDAKQIRFFFLAILLHLLVDAVPTILARYLNSFWVPLLITYAMSVGIAFIARTVWKKYARPADTFRKTLPIPANENA